MHELHNTPIWTVFVKKANDEQRASIERLLRHASAILERVIETFPTYTLHNHVHAENVVRLMGRLLGSRAADLTALEAAMLLLAAYYHDIGMVFDEHERQALANEESFRDFLGEHPEAYVAMEAAEGAFPLEIAEWYCRWRHPERVYAHLDRLEHDALDWGVVSLRDALATLCVSHSRDAATLHSDDLSPDFLGQCDLRFCAIVLRIADILDFDRTRSPQPVYTYLGLKERADRRKVLSDVEWRKHLAADGFLFPSERDEPYVLDFVAGPDTPAVEHDVRQFLDVIEAELHECAAVLGSCSNRWRGFPLPDRISRRNIKSRGYKYGEHRFTLDRGAVLCRGPGSDRTLD